MIDLSVERSIGASACGVLFLADPRGLWKPPRSSIDVSEGLLNLPNSGRPLFSFIDFKFERLAD